MTLYSARVASTNLVIFAPLPSKQMGDAFISTDVHARQGAKEQRVAHSIDELVQQGAQGAQQEALPL